MELDVQVAAWFRCTDPKEKQEEPVLASWRTMSQS